MDYESRQIKWYWLFLFMLYCGGVVYLLFQGNPFLYSHLELRSSMAAVEAIKEQTIPAKPDSSGKVAAVTALARYNFERTASDPIGTPRGKSYTEYEKHPLDLGHDGFKIENVAQDASGLYLTGSSPWVIAVGLDGQTRWRYRFKDSGGEPTVLLDENTAYLVHPKGEVVALNKADGQIRWISATKQDVAAQPVLWHKQILIPSKSTEGMQFVLVNRLDGQRDSESPHVDVKPGFLLTDAPDLAMLIATVDNKIIAINPVDWTLQWTQALTDPVKGHAVVSGTQIFAATLGAKVVKLDGSKKGKLEWEAEIEKPPASAPAYLPVVHRLAVMDTSGALSAIDAKTGKVFWRNAVQNHNPLRETWAARLSGKYIEEFKMDWLHKGWSIWTACADHQFCIFTPNKGQLINRIALPGAPVTLPLALEKRWVFLLETKPNQYTLAHIVEDGEVKRLKVPGN